MFCGLPPTQLKRSHQRVSVFPLMITPGNLAAVVAAIGAVAWIGAIAGRWWDLLTAWLIWGSVVLVALLCELFRSK